MKNCDDQYYQTLIKTRIMDLKEQSDVSRQARNTVELDQQSVGRLSRMDAIERKAMADATERRRHVEMEQLNSALKRLAENEFGFCIDCGDEIDPLRLESNLAVLKCISCAKG